MTAKQTRLTLDPETLRSQVRAGYGELALRPDGRFRFHTGRHLAELLGYPDDILRRLPDDAVASFTGVDNPFAPAPIPDGSRVVDLGSGGGFDCFVAGHMAGTRGHVVGVDMTPEMLVRARRVAAGIGATNVEFRDGILEELPIEDSWADVVISNGTLNLVADTPRALSEARRILRGGGALQFAGNAVRGRIPAAVRHDIALWIDGIAGSHSVDEWCELITAAGFADVTVGPATDSFADRPAGTGAQALEIHGHTFRARATTSVH